MIMPCSNTAAELANDRPIINGFEQLYLCVECGLDYPLNEMDSLTAIGDQGCCKDCCTEANGYA